LGSINKCDQNNGTLRGSSLNSDATAHVQYLETLKNAGRKVSFGKTTTSPTSRFLGPATTVETNSISAPAELTAPVKVKFLNKRPRR